MLINLPKENIQEARETIHILSVRDLLDTFIVWARGATPDSEITAALFDEIAQRLREHERVCGSVNG